MKLDIDRKGEWEVKEDELTIRTVEQKMDVVGAELHINHVNVSTSPEMEKCKQGLAKGVKASMKSETKIREIVSINENNLTYKIEFDNEERTIIAEKQ